MPTAGWECQGRREHGWFGSGTCEDPMTGGGAAGRLAADCPGCALRMAAYATIGHLPRGERASFESWLNQGGMQRLEAVVPAWMAGAGLDKESFRQRNFGADGSAKIAGLARDFGRNLRMALANRSAAQASGAAGESLAQLARETRPGSLDRAISTPPARPSTVPPITDFDPRWVNTTEAALRDPRSQVYDNLIRQELAEYNRRFTATPGFVPLNFRIFKAMLLVESGGPMKAEWYTQPFQIGNAGDAGHGVLQRGSEGSVLVMSPQLRDDVRKHSIFDPALNIRAGVAYVLTRMIETRSTSHVLPSEQAIHTYVVEVGDSLERISRRVGSTVDNLRQNNPHLGSNLRPGQLVAYQKADMRPIITGWRSITPESLMARYNGNKDALYARKIKYILDRI